MIEFKPGLLLSLFNPKYSSRAFTANTELAPLIIPTTSLSKNTR